ncbi:MAG: ABC transporter permease [Longimicrobiales bacterium]
MSNGEGRLWWRMAWRNLWRNKRRTALTASALSFGFVAAVLMIGLMGGIVEQMVVNGTEVATGQVQIHQAGFFPERSIHETLGGRGGVDVAAVLTAVDSVDQVVGAAPRVYGGGLVSSGDETVGAILMGIDAAREARVSQFGSSLIEGQLPSGGGVLIGVDMASDLGVGTGDEIVLVAPAADGSLGNDLFTVSGVFDLDSGAFDSRYALLDLVDLQNTMVLDEGRIHEIAISVTRTRDADAVAGRVEGAVTNLAEGLQTESWSGFLPQLYFFTSMASAANFMVAVIIFGMAVFGVANTMLLATYERKREFAVVRALGTDRRSVGRTVVYEGVLLGLISLVVGALLAGPLMVYLHANPIDLSRFVGSYSMVGAQVRPLLTVEYSWDGPLASGVALVLTGILSALYPAWKAVRIPPADALANR